MPLLALIMIAPLTPWIDRAIASAFYQMGANTVNHFVQSYSLTLLYKYGPWVGLTTAIISAVIFIFSYPIRAVRKLRRSAMLLMLTMAMGAGFITNVVLKEYWGRPRPTQVEEFGGQQQFRPFYSPNFSSQPEPSKSFPCGHCTAGFYFFALAVIGLRTRRRWLTATGFLLAFTLGGALGITRMAQGGHFFSDVFVGALVMWWTALTFDWLIYADLEEINSESAYAKAT